jgi:hypothetical protein
MMKLVDEPAKGLPDFVNIWEQMLSRPGKLFATREVNVARGVKFLV